MNITRLVAHRGFCSHHPENSIAGFRAALEAGIHYLELDVQLSADGVPVIIHDESLLRTGNLDVRVTDLQWSALKKFSVGEPDRLGSEFAKERIPALRDLVDLLAEFPLASLFVELKQESIDAFGEAYFLEQVAAVLQPIKARCAIISYNHDVLQLARETAGWPIGWVITNWDENDHAIADRLKPDFLICNQDKIQFPMWQGDWRWFLYEMTSANDVLRWQEKDVVWVESMDLPAILQETQFSQEGLHGL